MGKPLVQSHSDIVVTNSNYNSNALSDHAKNIIEHARYATDTSRQYQSDYRIFKRWLVVKGGNPDSPTCIDVLNFMADQFTGKLTRHNQTTGVLSDGGMIAPATIARRRWGILKELKSKGIHFTQLELETIAEYLAKIKMQGEQSKPFRDRGQSAPLRWGVIEKLMQCDLFKKQSEFIKLRSRALLAFMAVTGSREAEALGVNGVRLVDFSFTNDVINYSRMVLKQGERAYTFKGQVSKGKNPETCPYLAIKKYHQFISKHSLSRPDTKLFVRANKNGDPLCIKGDTPYLAQLGERTFDDFLRDAVISAGYGRNVASRVSGHSVRMGLVVGQVEAGKSYEQISKITGQSVATVERYAKQAIMTPFNGEF